ncbi:MAG TPA: beta-propeller fold lactonase family protein [Acidobacteriaceae bacterium]
MLGSAGAIRAFPQLQSLASSHAESHSLLLVGARDRSDGGAIHTLSIQDRRCEPLASIPAASPVALAVHPVRPIVYAANAVSRYRHEPRGTIEAFLVDQGTGHLQRLSRQPLSLSATLPGSLAVTPDGVSLLVAASGGGAYNLMPLDADGVPGPPSMILKQVGRGPQLPQQVRARPVSVLFRRRSLGIAADLGADRLDLFTADPEIPHRLAIVSRISLAPGSGPCALALHPDGDLLIAAQRLRPALTLLCFGGPAHLQIARDIPLRTAPAAIAWHPRHDLLYVVLNEGSRLSRLQAWQPDFAGGTLRPVAEITTPLPDIRAIHCEPTAVYLACSDGVMDAALDPATGIPLNVNRIASIPGAVSLAAVSQA